MGTGDINKLLIQALDLHTVKGPGNPKGLVSVAMRLLAGLSGLAGLHEVSGVLRPSGELCQRCLLPKPSSLIPVGGS